MSSAATVHPVDQLLGGMKQVSALADSAHLHLKLATGGSGIVLALQRGMQMTVRRIGPAFLALALMVALACHRDSTSPFTAAIAGHWEGSAALGTVQFEADFTQDGTAVGGTGHFSSPLGSGPFTISGQVNGRDVELTLISTEFGVTTYSGRFTEADRISGRLNAPDFLDLDLVLERD